MGCGCGGSPAVWQPARQIDEQPSGQTIGQTAEQVQQAHQQHADVRRVWPKTWSGRRDD